MRNKITPYTVNLTDLSDLSDFLPKIIKSNYVCGVDYQFSELLKDILETKLNDLEVQLKDHNLISKKCNICLFITKDQ